MVNVGLFPVRKTSVAPIYGTSESACFDLSACLEPGSTVVYYDICNEKREVTVSNDKTFILKQYERALIPTGWVFDIPQNYSMRIHPRSGLSLKNGVILANCEAVIDSDYTNETFVMLTNVSYDWFEISHGMRIAQGEVIPRISVNFSITDRIRTTDRTGGFGSSGV